MASSGSTIMEKPPVGSAVVSQDQQQQLRAILRCPRCDSSNTKFCYYNNYSLSQPRHFCKACKRYWTRGGTLRNVPVGGGCRKNKRLKKPTPSLSHDHNTTATSTTPTTQNHQIHSVSKAANHQQPQVNSSLFYSLPNQLSDVILSRFHLNSSNYDLQPQFNTLGLGSFSSTSTGLTTSGAMDHDDHRNGGFNPTTQIRDVMTSSSLLSNFSLLGTSASTATPMMTASLIESSLQHQKLNWGGLKESTRVPTSHYQDLSSPIEGFQMVGNGSDPRMVVKGVKTEEGKNKVDWSSPFESSMEPINGSDPSLYWNSMTVGGAWTDLSNYGSSVTPLI